MTESLPALIARLQSIPSDGAEYRLDGQTFRAILWHLRDCWRGRRGDRTDQPYCAAADALAAPAAILSIS